MAVQYAGAYHIPIHTAVGRAAREHPGIRPTHHSAAKAASRQCYQTNTGCVTTSAPIRSWTDSLSLSFAFPPPPAGKYTKLAKTKSTMKCLSKSFGRSTVFTHCSARHAGGAEGACFNARQQKRTLLGVHFCTFCQLKSALLVGFAGSAHFSVQIFSLTLILSQREREFSYL